MGLLRVAEMMETRLDILEESLNGFLSQVTDQNEEIRDRKPAEEVIRKRLRNPRNRLLTIFKRARGFYRSSVICTKGLRRLRPSRYHKTNNILIVIIS